MLQALRVVIFPDPSAPIRPVRLALTPALVRGLIFSQIMAVVWCLVALEIRKTGIVQVWADQGGTFTQGWGKLANPFVIPNFIYPPWAILLLAPFGLPPFDIAVFIQVCLYFGLIALVIFKFGGSEWIVLLTLLSFIGLMATVEMNIEWITCLGLLVPPALSGPFLLVKPQSALGVWFSFTRRELVRALLVALGLTVASFVIWGPDWPLLAWGRIQYLSLGRIFNVAPSSLLPLPLAFAIGIGLAYFAIRHKDPILGIFSWLFFVPYIAFYSLLVPFGLFAIRFPRLALVISGCAWVVYSVLAYNMFVPK